MSEPSDHSKDGVSAEVKEETAQYTIDGIEDGDAVDDMGLRIEGFTKRDQRDMQRMGKRQELMRNFRPLSALSFTVILQATWEFLLMYVTPSLYNYL